MIRRLPLVLSCMTCAAAASAQDIDRRVELREFAVPAPSDDGEIRQLDDGTADAAVVEHFEQTDRTITIQQPAAPAGVGIAQVPRAREVSTNVQVNQDATLGVDPGSLSSPSESAPGSVARLGGTDRCDQQGDPANYRACLRILERRAAEFSAPAAPRLSAEEVLLTQQGADEEDAALTINERIRRASQTQPDADLASNQELASLILPDPQQLPVNPADEEASTRGAEIEAVLKAIGLPVAPQP